MRSFRLSRAHIFEPEKVAADYSESERQSFKKEFRPIAQAIRKKQFRSSICVFVAIIFLLGLMLSAFGFHNKNASTWFGAGFAVCVIAGAMVQTGKICCPGCRQDVRDALSMICPECGEKTEFLCWRARCSVCRRILVRWRSGPNYTIRNCTYCGLRLDDEGF